MATTDLTIAGLNLIIKHEKKETIVPIRTITQITLEKARSGSTLIRIYQGHQAVADLSLEMGMGVYEANKALCLQILNAINP